MNYEELKASYRKHLKIGIGTSFIVHLLIISLLLILQPNDENNRFKEKQTEITIIDLYKDGNAPRPPGLTEDKPGGGGRSNRISGLPVPTMEVKKAKEFDPAAPAKGDSTKSGSGGSGIGSGTGSGAPVNVFKKSDYLVAVEIQPEPIGGYGAIDKKVVMPDAAKKNSISGKVFLQVYINENGEVVFAEVLKGLGFGCDEAALKAVKMIRFKAGKQKGKYAKVQMSVPVNFIN